MFQNLANKLKITNIRLFILVYLTLTKPDNNDVRCQTAPQPIDDFRALRLHLDARLFVDKSLLIKEILQNDTGDLIMITRPPQFGKTCNLKMLERFFQTPLDYASGHLDRKLFIGGEIQVDGTPVKLDKLKIADHRDIIDRHLGKHPVIYFSFKNCRTNNSHSFMRSWGLEMFRLFSKHGYDKKFDQLFADSGDRNYEEAAIDGLFELALIMWGKYQKRVTLLIDDYDSLIFRAHKLHGSKSNELAEIIEHLNQMIIVLTSRKIHPVPGTGNPIDRIVFTGITPFHVFEAIVRQYTMADEKLSPFFGFTDIEVDSLFDAFPSHRTSKKRVKIYYKGNTIGDQIIYNVVSIPRYLQNNQSLRPYWHTNETLDVFNRVPLNNTVMPELERIARRTMHIPLRTPLTFDHTIKTLDDTFAFLFHAGYLDCSPVPCKNKPGTSNCSILNAETETLLHTKILDWLNATYDLFNRTHHREKLLEHLSLLEFTNFKNRAEHILRMATVNGLYNETQRYYIDLLEVLITEQIDHRRYYPDDSSVHIIFLLNSEQGYVGVILNLELASKANIATLAPTAIRGLARICESNYDAQMKRNSRVRYVVKLSIAFCKHRIGMRYRVEERNHTVPGQFVDVVFTTVRPVKTKNIPNRFKSGVNHVMAEDIFTKFIASRLPVNNVIFLDFIEKSLELSKNNMVTFKRYLKSKKTVNDFNRTILHLRNAIIDPDLYISPHAILLTKSKHIIANFTKAYEYTVDAVVDVMHRFHQNIEITTIFQAVRRIFQSLDESIHT